MLSYSHFFESWGGSKAMKDIPAAFKYSFNILGLKAPQNHRQLRHQLSVAIKFLSRSGSGSMITLIRQPSLQTGAEIAKAEVAGIDDAALCSKYAGKKVRAGLGGWRSL